MYSIPIDHVDHGPRRPQGCDYPLLVRISGAPEALQRLEARAPGMTDVPPVDFTAWAASMAPDVAAGLDPIHIERAVARTLVEHGIPNPRAAMADSFHHRQMQRVLSGRSQSEDWAGFRGHGLTLPGFCINPDLTAEGRRAAFLDMVQSCQAEQSRRHPSQGTAPQPTAFSLPALLPLPAAEVVPTWCGRNHPERHPTKRGAWGLPGGGLDAAVMRREADALVVVGVMRSTIQDAWSYRDVFRKVVRDFNVRMELTSWGEMTAMTPEGGYDYRHSFREAGIRAAASPHGVTAIEELTALFDYGRTDQAANCLMAIREHVLRPPLAERVAEAAVRGMVSASQAIDRMDDRIGSAARRIGAFLSKEAQPEASRHDDQAGGGPQP